MEIEQLIIILKASAFKWGLAASLPRVLKYPMVYTYLMKPVEIRLLESRQSVVIGPTFGSSLYQSVDQKHQTQHLPGCEKTTLRGFLDVGGKRELGCHWGLIVFPLCMLHSASSSDQSHGLE